MLQFHSIVFKLQNIIAVFDFKNEQCCKNFSSKVSMIPSGLLDYIITLKQFSKYCDLDKFLNETLHNLFVCGLHLQSAQKKLLTEAREPNIQEGL